MHHISTNYEDVLKMRIGGDQASSLCQSGREGGASASNIPCAGIDAAKFELGHNRGRRGDVIGTVSAHNYQVDILRGQTGIGNGCFACCRSQVRSRPVFRGVKAGFDTAVILKLANNLRQFWADLTHPLSKDFVGNLNFGKVHPGS